MLDLTIGVSTIEYFGELIFIGCIVVFDIVDTGYTSIAGLIIVLGFP
jgi:hypothetical protein